MLVNSASSSISQQPQQPSYLSQSYDSSTTLLHDHTAPPSWLNKSSHPPSSSSYHPDNASINSSSIATTFSPLSSQHDPTNAIWMMPGTHTNANGNDLHQGSVTKCPFGKLGSNLPGDSRIPTKFEFGWNSTIPGNGSQTPIF